MRKLLKTGAWICGAIGSVMMFIGVIAVLAGSILFNHYWTNYFYPGVGFVILGIFLFLSIIVCREEK